MTQTAIQTTNLHKHLGKLRVLRGINMEVKRGEVVVFIGPSGCASAWRASASHVRTGTRSDSPHDKMTA